MNNNITSRDYTNLTPTQAKLVASERAKYLKGRKTNKVVFTLEKLERKLNKLFNLDKSIRSYRRVWESLGQQ